VTHPGDLDNATPKLPRRDAIVGMGVAALGASALSPLAFAQAGRMNDRAPGAPGAPRAPGGLDLASLGFNSATGEYTLPPLPYDYDALEPHIDAQTMQIHHTKHHQGYVNGLNKALAELKKIRDGSGDSGLIKHWSRELAFHGGGHINHTLFWHTMAPPGSSATGGPSGALARAINDSFGSLDAFKAHFSAGANAVEASGWAWLMYEPISKSLIVTQMEKQQDVYVNGARPLLGIDVWEHAYYLRYQNRRADYTKAFWNVVNWDAVGSLYDAARA
jgi:Fe-Mn family superoxide dismutase